jgi:hypothetical protein
MPQTIEQALSQATFYSDHQDYVLLQLPARAIMAAAGIIAEIGEPFSVLIADKDEVSLLISTEALEAFADRLPDQQSNHNLYRLITIDVALDPNLTGFMAHLSTALAEVGVPVFPYAAFTRDHIVVPAEHFERALTALEKLKTT